MEKNGIKEITNATFKDLEKLQHLKLSGNNITRIEPGAFRSNLKLTMVALDSNPIQNVDNLLTTNLQIHYLDLENSGLNRFPKGMPWTVKYLKLSKNNITRITKAETQEYAFISVIILEGNNLSYIEKGAFSHMGFLTDVFLIKNNLDSIPGPFPQSLRSLYLDKNKITTIPMASFQHGTSLTVLSLRSNQIREITPPSFANLLSIQELHLERNPFVKLHDNVFLFVRGLEYMSLNYLHLSTIYQDCFLGLEALEKLELSFVKVPAGKIYGNPFLSTPSLRTLTLQESPNLAKYVLESEQILKSVNNLTSLNLMDNKLRTLKPRFQQALPNLQEIKLAGNEFSCDINLLWLRKWIALEPEKFVEPHNVLCFYPQRHYGTAILDVAVQDFQEPEIPDYESQSSIHVTSQVFESETNTTEFYQYNYYDPDFSSYETYSSEELHDYDYYYPFQGKSTPKTRNKTITFQTTTSTIEKSGNITLSEEKSSDSENNSDSNIARVDTDQDRSKAKAIGIAVAMGFGVVFGMLLIAGVVYCFWRRRNHVVHNEARLCKTANDYVFIVSKKDSEVPPKSRRLTREERGSTTSKASEDITNSADPTMKVYMLND